MDLEKLIERVVGELMDATADVAPEMFPVDFTRAALRAAFAEVRRGAINDAARHAFDLGADRVREAIRALLPPAAEGVANLPGLLRAAAERMCGCGELMDENGCPHGH